MQGVPGMVTIGSMFAGALGLDLGIQGAFPTARTAWVADVCGTPDTPSWPHKTPHGAPCTILAHRAPDAPNLGDVSRIDWSTVEPVDIIAAGFPCQDVSTAGARRGLRDGTRTGLWSEVVAAITALKPRMVVLENVRGLLSASADCDVEPCSWCLGDGPGNHMRALGAVLADLADVGYDAVWCGLRAADVGAPHGRFRVFIVAYPAAADREGQQQREPEHARMGQSEPHGGIAPHPESNRRDEGRPEPARHLGGHDAPLSRDPHMTLLPTPTVQDSKNTAGESQFDRNTIPLNTVVSILPTPTASDYGTNQSASPEAAVRPSINKLAAEQLIPTPSVADALGGHEARGGDRAGELLLNGMAKHGRLDRFGPYALAIARWEQVLGHPAPNPTEPTGRGGAHRLSPRFTEWLMGWPDGWVTKTTGITRNEALKACGNGVVPQQATEGIRWCLQWVPTSILDIALEATA